MVADLYSIKIQAWRGIFGMSAPMHRRTYPWGVLERLAPSLARMAEGDFQCAGLDQCDDLPLVLQTDSP